jgi:hypothetical protein
VGLPFLLLWSLYKLGYDNRGWLAQTVLTWTVYPLCYIFTGAERNINWVYGPGKEPQTWMPDYLWVLLLMISVPLLIYLPTHLVLKRLFTR